MTPEEFRAAGHRVVDFIADYRARVESGTLPVMAQTSPGEVRATLSPTPPEEGSDFASLLSAVERDIVPGLTLWQHPAFFGYFPANSSLPSVLGDFLSTGLGVLGLSWQSAPALTEVEEVTTDWVRQLVGLSPVWRGVIQETASASTFIALVCARERASKFAFTRSGLQGGEGELVVYTSAHAHSSVDKAAFMAGIGRAHVRHVDCDARHAIRPDALRDAMAADKAAGRIPCAVVATVGTTAVTALDPVRAIAEVATEYGAWLHVDAAMGGSAMLLPECRWMWDGIEQADSLVVNVHKWLGVAFDCSLYFVRDDELLVRVMSTNPSYLRTAVDDKVRNYRDWGIALGRRFRALKLWAQLHVEGAEALRARLRRDLENARWLAAQVEATPGWRVVAPVNLQTVCIRHEPAGLDPDALDAHTQRWCDAINRSGRAYLTPATLDGRWMVRVSIGIEHQERDDVARAWAVIQREAERSLGVAVSVS